MSSHDQSNTEHKPSIKPTRKDNAVHASLSLIHLSKSTADPKADTQKATNHPVPAIRQAKRSKPKGEAPTGKRSQAPPPMSAV